MGSHKSFRIANTWVSFLWIAIYARRGLTKGGQVVYGRVSIYCCIDGCVCVCCVLF